MEDDRAKILVGMRLKGKALEWLHSKPEFIGMSFDALIDELRLMFRRRRDKVTTRRTFEARVWKKDETFREYVHEKMIMGNRVPIGVDEMMDYIIDGIPDNMLRSLARTQRFAETDSLLEAFESITLRDCHVAGSSRPDRRGSKPVTSERDGEIGRGEREENTGGGRKKTISSVKKCFNCAVRDHISVNCPSRNLGSKCFECGEFEHIASKCPKKKDAPKSSCVVTHSSRKKYTKDVAIDGTKIEALINTGSDISLMRADEYIKMGSPRFREAKIRFSGIRSGEIAALGEFQAELTVDGHSYPILIRVVSDTVSRQKLLIGTDFLDTVEVNVKRGVIAINPICKQVAETGSDGLDVFRIDVGDAYEANGVEVSHVRDVEHKHAIAALVEDYRPSKMREIDVEMTIILKDDESVYQRARRLSPSERSIVNSEIEEWEKQGIVCPSCSDYAAQSC